MATALERKNSTLHKNGMSYSYNTVLKYEPEFKRTGHPTGQLLALLSLWHGRRRLEWFFRRWRHRNLGVWMLRRLTGTLRRLRWLKGWLRRLNRLDLWGEKPGVGGEHQLQAYQRVAVPRTPTHTVLPVLGKTFRPVRRKNSAAKKKIRHVRY